MLRLDKWLRRWLSEVLNSSLRLLNFWWSLGFKGLLLNKALAALNALLLFSDISTREGVRSGKKGFTIASGCKLNKWRCYASRGDRRGGMVRDESCCLCWVAWRRDRREQSARCVWNVEATWKEGWIGNRLDDRWNERHLRRICAWGSCGVSMRGGSRETLVASGGEQERRRLRSAVVLLLLI